MCLITFAYKQHPDYPLIVLSNRDEFYARPSQYAHFWSDEPRIFAGRDLQSFGTWLGVTKDGRFAAVTNYRDPTLPDIGEKSRGYLVRSYLTATAIDNFYNELIETRGQYGGYNFIGYDGESMFHYNNILNEGGPVMPGIHSISNASLNTPWPKVKFARLQLTNALHSNATIDDLKILLQHTEKAPDHELPSTGVGIYLERILSSPFVKTTGYGTKSSATVLFHQQKEITFIERLYDAGEFTEEKINIIQIKK